MQLIRYLAVSLDLEDDAKAPTLWFAFGRINITWVLTFLVPLLLPAQRRRSMSASVIRIPPTPGTDHYLTTRIHLENSDRERH